MTVIGALGSAAAIGYFWWTQPERPVFDADARSQIVAQSVENMTPTDGWAMWVNVYRVMAREGMQPLEFPGMELIDAAIQQSKFHQTIALAALSVFLLAALLVLVFVRSPTTR